MHIGWFIVNYTGLGEKEFSTGKIKSETFFAFTLIVWPVYVPNACFPHKLLLSYKSQLWCPLHGLIPYFSPGSHEPRPVLTSYFAVKTDVLSLGSAGFFDLI